jgi:hypothetical protein
MEDGTAVKQTLKDKQKGRRNLGRTKEIDRSIRYLVKETAGCLSEQ